MNSSDLLNALSKLYTSGAWLCLAIVATFVVLDWLSKNVAWFEVPNRAHYLTAFLGGLALVVVPATQGTTPNVQTIAIAIGTVYALFTRGAVPVAKVAKVARPAQSGFVTRWMMGYLAVFGIVIACFAAPSCSASQKAAEHTALVCAENAVVKDLTPTVESILVNGAATWEAQLAALGVAFTTDVVNCAVTSAKAVLAAKTGATPAEQTAAQRADQWLKDHP